MKSSSVSTGLRCLYNLSDPNYLLLSFTKISYDIVNTDVTTVSKSPAN